MFEKHLWKSDILSKDAGRWSGSLLKMSLPQVFFKHFASKNQLSGLALSGTLFENGLIIILEKQSGSIYLLPEIYYI